MNFRECAQNTTRTIPEAKDLLSRFDAFILKLSKKDRCALIHHTDADGITAGVIAAKALERITGKKPALVLYPGPNEVTLSKKIISELKKKKIGKVVIVDLNVDQEPASVKATEKFAEILVLDHHSIQNDINSPKTVMVKPQYFSEIDPSRSSRSAGAALEAFDGSIEPSKYCAAKLVHDMFSRKINLDDLKWLAVIGIYGDMAEKQWPAFIESAKIPPEKIKKACGLIVYARSFDEKEGPMKAFRVFYSACSIDDVLDSSLSKYAAKIETELAHYIKNREKLAEFYEAKKLIIYEISPKYNIKSELVNRLSREFCPEWTCIVIQKKGKVASIGARNQSGKVAMNELLIKATSGIKGASGGGHVQAAGGSVPNKSNAIKKVTANIINILK